MKYSNLLLLILLSLIVSACKPETSNKPEQSTSITAKSKTAEPMPRDTSDSSCQFVLGFDAWEPYQYVDVGHRIAGLDIELVEAIIERMGCQLTFQQGTWVEMLKALKEGEVDMLLGASKTPAREEFAFFSDAYRMEEFSIYIRKGDDKLLGYQTLSDFINNDSKIGIVGDYVYGSEVSDLLDNPQTSANFVNAIMGELNVARLLDGDIDAYIEDSFVGATLLRRKALSNYIMAHGITIKTGDAYVMFSQKSVSKEQVSDFNSQLAKIKQDKTYQKILDKYSY